MLRLTREVRLTLPFSGECDFARAARNALAGNLTDGPGMYCAIMVTLEGEQNPTSHYVENITVIDEAVRTQAADAMLKLMRSGQWTLERAAFTTGERLSARWRELLQGVRMIANPCLWCDYLPRESPMFRLTQRFDFAAAHRLHNDAVDDETNRSLFGKCNNPAGHGHNYQLEVTLAGDVDDSGQLIGRDQFCQAVQTLVLDRFDHKHLNVQTEEFRNQIPSVENIARVIFELLEKPFGEKLHSVRVWETAKTSAEYRR